MLLSKLLGSSLATRTGSYRVSEVPGALLGGQPSSAGIDVSEEGALSLSAVFAACNLLSRVIGTLPLKVYRQDGGDSRRRVVATKHPTTRVLGWQANPEMSAAVARRVLEFHRLLWGNGYAEIGWAGSGTVAAIWPVEPWRVEPKRDEGGLYYLVDGARKVSPEDMLHTQLVSYDGVSGRSFVEYAISSLGLGIATQEFAARYFGNGARPGVILEHPGSPSADSRREMRRSWDERHQGPHRASGTAVLWGGWQYKTDGGFDPEKSQLLEQRRFTVEEVARWLNLPPHLLRELSRATFSNIEHQGIDFVTYSIGPTIIESEQEFDRKLLSPPNLYCKHNLNGLLRGDSAARSAYYREQFGIGAMTLNEIRELEERNPVEGGDVHFVPLNMVPLARALEEPEEPSPQPEPPPEQEPEQGEDAPTPPDAKDDSGPVAGMRGLLVAALTRLAKVEANAIARAAEQPGKFLAKVEEFYESHKLRLVEVLVPFPAACDAVGVRFTATPESWAEEWCAASRECLLGIAGIATHATLAAQLQRSLEYTRGARSVDWVPNLIEWRG